MVTFLMTYLSTSIVTYYIQESRDRATSSYLIMYGELETICPLTDALGTIQLVPTVVYSLIMLSNELIKGANSDQNCLHI